MTSTSSYCAQLVKKQDPDRFLLSHFAPAKHREALWALFAFNYEIAKTREIVSETQLGLIRLQWWRDTIEKIYAGEIIEHAVVTPLAQSIRDYALPQSDFEALIFAREFDLEDVLPTHVEGFMHYADYTSTPLLRLVMRVLGANIEFEPVQIVATNYAIAGLLRAVVPFARQRRCFLPQDLMTQNKVSVNTLYELKPQGGLTNVIKTLAKQFVDDVPCDNHMLKSTQHLAKLYLTQLQRIDYDVFDPRITIPPAFKALRLLFNF